MPPDPKLMTLRKRDYGIGIVPMVDIFLRVYRTHLHRIFRRQTTELLQDKLCFITIEIPWRNGYAYGEIGCIIIFQSFALIRRKTGAGPRYEILEIRRIRMSAIMLTPGKLPVQQTRID